MKRHILLFECGHWTYESAPDSFTPDPDQPRVCSHFIGGQPSPHGSRYPLSPQGLALVPVTHYLPDPRECPYHDGSETCPACRDGRWMPLDADWLYDPAARARARRMHAAYRPRWRARRSR